MKTNVNTRMDEANQQTIQGDSEAVPTDLDHDGTVKGTADDDPEKLLPRKSSGDVLSSETAFETNTLSTNGIYNETVKTQVEDDNPTGETKSELESSQTNENVIQSEENTSTIYDNLGDGTSGVNKKFEDGAKDLINNGKETDKEISVENNFSEADCLYSFDRNIRNSNGEQANDSNEKNTKGETHLETEDVMDQQNVSEALSDVRETENVENREQNNISDLSLNNESSKNNTTTENTISSGLNEEVQRTEIDTINDTVNPQPEEVNFVNSEPCEEKKDESDSEATQEMEIAESEDKSEGNFSKPAPTIIDSNVCSPSNEEGKTDETSQSEKDKEKSISSISEELSFEIENENQDFQSKIDCIQESNSSQSNANTSNTSMEQDEESTNKSENDGIEVMDTEMVNCNEIEQIDLSENENQKDKEVDRIRIEPSEAESKGEQKDEEMMMDVSELSEEKFESDVKIIESEDKINEENEQKDASMQGEVINQPGNSEEETITGDTSHQGSDNLAKEKDEEVCIIPDDMTPRHSILSQKEESKGDAKNSEADSAENSGSNSLRVSLLELEKTKTAPDDAESQSEKKKEVTDNSKSRPVRNAAKLAGNKIKSLVQNDFVYEEPASGAEIEGDIQENPDDSSRMCVQCKEVKVCKFLTVQGGSTQYLCSEGCSGAFSKATPSDAEVNEVDNATGECIRKCGQCHSQVTIDDRCLFWETMDFCNEDCLGKYQTELGSSCANCKGGVVSSSLGKYCVRFGYDVKQFCSASCLEEYKKGLKVCSYCQKDISTAAEGFLAPVGDRGQFKDFCTQSCMEKYERMSSNVPLPDVIEECAVCSNSKPVRVEVELDNKTHKLCSEPCFAAFKFVNNITEGQCDMCRKYFDRLKTGNFSLFYDETPHSFCCKTCMNVYILANRKIVPCNWCKVKKYNFDMIKKVSANGQLTMMCSLNCLMLYQASVSAVCSRRIKCDFCQLMAQAQYHLTMSDATIRNFCSYNCVISFQNRYSKQAIDIIPGSEQLSSPIPTGVPKRIVPRRSQVESSCGPVISSVQSLASPNGPASPSARVPIPRGDVNLVSQVTPISQSLTIPTTVAPMPAPPPQIYQQIVTKPAPAKVMKNKSILCKPYSHTKGVSCRPHPCMKETQTDQSLNRKFLIPIPVPIYVPAPMHMFATPFPVPVPFPLPVPVPIFIPTTRNSAKGIFKEIKKIQEKIPTDPFEAELLMMAEMVAGEKKQDPTDSESEDGNDGDDGGDGTFSPENVDTSNTFGDDMLQMALKMASELEEPAVDMESVLTSNTITTSAQPQVDPNKALYSSDPDDPDQVHVMSMNRGRKRSIRGSRNSAGGTPSKRGRRTSGSVDVPLLPPPEPVPPPRIEVEKPDANMCLKYTFGVNAWRHWVMQKNAELEKVALTNRKIKLFKPELLQLTADELNFSLCLFVKEVRKPNGTEYAPDTIYYLCLGIQQYLFENGRIDNIFTDSYYEKFTDCLDEVAKKFAALYNDSQYIVTRVEEEHLWESKQLGAHSPHVLLSTLMFFNTKHFNLVTVEEHMQLSFSHIMKHWKRNPNTPGVAKVPGSRNVLLRFYPPQSALEANSRKKKVYEQQENEENPLRCPVKLYEFYLSKCPESVKTRNDVFYLLPERSCVPDSPVWYSTMALGKEPLMKMLHRVKMVKEINIALLTC